MKKIKIGGFWVYRLIKYLVILILGYLGLAILGTLIPTGKLKPQKQGEILIFVTTNGLHSDIIVPLKNAHWDWLAKFDSEFKPYQNHAYLAFGWGDYDFYLQSKTGTNILDILNTLFIPSQGILHLDFYAYQPRPNAQTIQLGIDANQYKNLCQYLDNQIITNQKKQLIKIENGYGADDYFFAAKGYYQLFYTCNNWTNDALKTTGLRTGIWTPFREGIWFWLG